MKLIYKPIFKTMKNIIRQYSSKLKPKYFFSSFLIVFLGFLFHSNAYALSEDSNQPSMFDDISMLSTSVVSHAMEAVVQIQVVGVNRVDRRNERGNISRFKSTGSGFVIASDGYIITNAHVVSGAQKIRVILSTESMTDVSTSILEAIPDPIEAELIGLDEETDLAVLKIERNGLPTLKLAAFDNVKIGQLVWAIGSPLGLRNSVTMGIVSTVARQLQRDSPMIFLQTDASINPGSSGGPIVNSESEVVSISSSILSQSGGSDGVSLSIPSHIVEYIYKKILQDGYVKRGDIGVKVQTITPLFSEALGLKVKTGVIFSDVFPGTTAFKAGLRPWDIVLSIDEKPIENARQFIVNLYQKEIGGTVSLEVLHSDNTKKIYTVNVVEKRSAQNISGILNNILVPKFGILIEDADNQLTSVSRFKRGDGGVRVVAKWADSAKNVREIKVNDVIYSINKKSVNSTDDMLRATQEIVQGDPVVIYLQRGKNLQFVNFYSD